MSILAWNDAIFAGFSQIQLGLLAIADPSLVLSATLVFAATLGCGALLSSLRRYAAGARRTRPDLRVVRGGNRTPRTAPSMRDALVAR